MLCTNCFRVFDAREPSCATCGTPLSEKRRVDLLAERLAASGDPSIGKTYGERYLVRGYVGKGGMARVYLAEDRTTGAPVALKVLDSRASREPDVYERFFQEARAAAKIRHPNIVDIFDSGQHEDGTPYLAMEFLFGESVGDLLRREGAIAARRALVVIHNAAAGLDAAHRVGIIHRDLKPDNIFLVGAIGAPYAVKVLDFGLAKLLEAQALTAIGTTVGTIAYMAPEQVLAEPSDARTDVYGLGIVLYRALTGKLPFVDGDEAKVLASQLIAVPTAPSSLVAGLDPGVEAFAMKTLRKRPENRYASMAALREDLGRLVGKRDGELAARAPLAHETDVYEPRFGFSRQAAIFYYKKLGVPLPDWKSDV